MADIDQKNMKKKEESNISLEQQYLSNEPYGNKSVAWMRITSYILKRPIGVTEHTSKNGAYNTYPLLRSCIEAPIVLSQIQNGILYYSPKVNLGSKLGIDATQKTLEEGFEREIQEQVKVDDDTKTTVDSKWSSYGL